VIRWHLCNLNGQSTRIVEADSLFWAKRRLAPIPKGWMVISDASYRTPAYQVQPELVDICTTCERQPRVVGYRQCYDCANHNRNKYRRKVTQKVDPLTLEQRKERWREARAKQHATITADPERVAKRSARLSAAQKARYEKERQRYRMALRQSSIRAGIERRRAKRETQLLLGV